MLCHVMIAYALDYTENSLNAQFLLDLPTSRAQCLSRARSASGRFFMFSAARESETFALGPTTGTGNEKRRTLRKSKFRFVSGSRQLISHSHPMKVEDFSNRRQVVARELQAVLGSSTRSLPAWSYVRLYIWRC